MRRGAIINVILFVFLLSWAYADTANLTENNTLSGNNNLSLNNSILNMTTNNSINNYTETSLNQTGNSSALSLITSILESQYGDYVLIIIIVGAIISLLYYFIFRHLRGQDKSTVGFITFKRSVGETQAFTFMKKEYRTFNENQTVYEAIELFVEDSVFIIPILKDRKVAGVLTKASLLEKLDNYSYDFLSKEKIKRYIIKEGLVFCKSENTLEEILEIMKKNNSESIIILDDYNNFKGFIDLYDILRMFNQFHIKMRGKVENPPILGPIMDKKLIIIEPDLNIIKLKRVLLKNKSNFALVCENQICKRIVTLKDILVSIYNGHNPKNTVTKHISSTIVNFNPGSLISESLKVFLVKRYNQIPLYAGNKTVGVAKLSDVIYEDYYNYIKLIED